MRTVVYQSFRTTNVPAWIATCMQTVARWASDCGFEYRCFDDEFFNFAPDWFREKAGHQICPITDLARLVAAKHLTEQEGFDRAVWVDADLLVFAPEALVVDTSNGFALCYEVWCTTSLYGHTAVAQRVNNCIAAFQRGTVHLDFLIDACLRIAKSKQQLEKLDVGTQFLTALRNILPFDLITHVGTFSPSIVTDIAAGDGIGLRDYAKALPHPLACANFCASLSTDAASTQAWESAISRCLNTRGQIVNQWRGPSRTPAVGAPVLHSR